MSDPASEPEKYSIDEMMDRLKNRETSEKKGELVTRSDGTKAVRMRKRKRRTNQTGNDETKRNQRMQILQIAIFVVVLLLMFVAAGIGILYANSSGFREDLISKVESVTGAEVAFAQFRMNPAAANAAKITMEWPPESPLKSLEVNSVVAKIEPVSFLGTSFKGEEIIADSGYLILKNPVGVQTMEEDPADLSVNRILFQRYSVPNLNIHFGQVGNNKPLLEKTEASYFPSEIPGHGEIRLSKGILQVENWPSLELDRSFISVKDRELDIRSMRFVIPSDKDRKVIDEGLIELSGIVRPFNFKEGCTLSVKVEAFRLSPLLGRDLGGFFLGRVVTADEVGTNLLTIEPDGADAVLEIAISNAIDSRIDITRFRFLSFLALTLDDRWYDLPNFSSEASAVLRRRGQEVELNEINFEQRGRMALSGSIRTTESGEISGEFRIGIPESMIVLSKNKRLDSMFSAVKKGYRWVDLKIDGTSEAPEDNFQQLYESFQDVSENSTEESDGESTGIFEEPVERE